MRWATISSGLRQRVARAWRRAARALTPAGECEPAPIHGRSPRVKGPAGLWNDSYTFRIPGDYGAVDITLSRLRWAAEATVEVVISEVQTSFDLLLGCITSGLDKEIRLFDGTITEPRGLKRSVVAVRMRSLIELNFKVGALSSSLDHCCSFKPKYHGHDTRELKTTFALISVKDEHLVSLRRPTSPLSSMDNGERECKVDMCILHLHGCRVESVGINCIIAAKTEEREIGEQEKYDVQLIDGASLIGPAGLWNDSYTFRIPGDYGAVDITLSRLRWAAEATVEVVISEVQTSFDLLLGCITSGLDKEIRLFDGTITEPRGLKRSVVAVRMRSLIELNFKVGALSSSLDHCCSFKPKYHGHDTRELKTTFALISVKDEHLVSLRRPTSPLSSMDNGERECKVDMCILHLHGCRVESVGINWIATTRRLPASSAVTFAANNLTSASPSLVQPNILNNEATVFVELSNIARDISMVQTMHFQFQLKRMIKTCLVYLPAPALRMMRSFILVKS
uniref:DUF6598 domain-containing protein n=1 Tax=Oryza nivara TaxID=4536 RepID=A0A0E0I4Z6_ORYNI